MKVVKVMNERYNKILELLAKEKKIEVATLSQLLGVSQVTIRKDLDHLENNGLVVRVHGFARLNDSDDINQRLAFHYDLKQKIAKKAAESIENGETIMIESGSCCALLALEIVQTKKDVTIITNSAFIADYIRKAGNCKIILLGGEYQNEAQVMVGPMIRKCVEAFFVDKLFIGTDGFSVDSGFTGNDYMRCEAVRDMAKQASHIIVVSESSKFHQKGVVKLLETNEIHAIVTDENIPEDKEKYLIDTGVDVIKAF